jgi:toxin ParE1/3/4
VSWRIIITAPAQRDMRAAIRQSRRQFGPLQAERYGGLLRLALRCLRDGPEVAGSRGRDDLQKGLRTLHIARFVKHASHLLLYAAKPERRIVVFRILHERMDVARHIGGTEVNDS